MRKLVILDRDGVINEDSDAFIKSAEEWIPLPGSIDAIARLSRAGYQVFVVTNQSGIGRGYFTEGQLAAMHRKLARLVAEAGGQLSGIYHCPHLPDAGCDCRKPRAGMFDRLMAEHGLASLGNAPVVGDSLRDLQAGLARGGQPVLVRSGKGVTTESRLAEHPELAQCPVFDDLAAFVDNLLGKKETP